MLCSLITHVRMHTDYRLLKGLRAKMDEETWSAIEGNHFSSIKWQTYATFDSFYFLSNCSLYMFRATCVHHQEFSLLYIQPPVICVAVCPRQCLVVNKTALYMFRATCAHHQEFSLLYIQPPVICVAVCPWHCHLARGTCLKQDSAADRQQHR
jgi:hypothetical protein